MELLIFNKNTMLHYNNVMFCLHELAYAINIWKKCCNKLEQKANSGRPYSVQMQQNISRVSPLICRQEDNPGTS